MDSIKITGFATYYNIKDYHNDVIKKGAFAEEVYKFQINGKKLKLLAHHNTLVPIAKINTIEETDQGLYIEAIINKNNNEEIFYQIANDLIGDLSVGIIPTDIYHEKTTRIIKKAQLLEISVVTIGANPQAKILSVEYIN